MNVNVSMKKVVVVLVLMAVVFGGAWRYMETAPERKTEAEIKVLVDFAQRQALEIAIIEQSFKLTEYKRQIAKVQKPVSPVKSKPEVAPIAKDE